MDEISYQNMLESVKELSAKASLLICNRNSSFWSPQMKSPFKAFNKKNFLYGDDRFTGKTPEEVLKEAFGFSEFRPLQKEIISNVLDGRDTLAVMPTGGGKSLCYEIPALIMDGLTIVVSPLIALMQDQVWQLNSIGIDAVFLNSTLDWNAYKTTTDKIRCGKVKILYLSPEALNTQRIRELLHSELVEVKCITIDEAHCISEWGHDFRPDYLEIAGIREQFPRAVCLALTATATKMVQADIVKQLKMELPDVLTASFNRPNIYLEVKRKCNGFEQVISFLENHKKESGIIYCFSRQQVDVLTEKLLAEKFKVVNYHAGLTDEQRAENQNGFIKDKVNIIVCTVAFGMGINKPDVRFVINYDLPKSIEEYYQQIGRSGRDGLPAHALLLYSASDIHKIRYFFNEKADTVQSERLLNAMISFADNTVCRRKQLLNYFGENYTASKDDGYCCDVCTLKLEYESDTGDKTDMTVPVQKLFSCILRTGQFYSRNYVIDVLLGSKNKKIIEREHDCLSTFGIGKELKKNEWKVLTDILISTGYLLKENEFDVIQVTEKGMLALQNRDKFMLPFELSERKKKTSLLQKKHNSQLDENDAEGNRISEDLRVWRKKMAEENNVPPYVIFGDKTLYSIAANKPGTIDDLLNCYGIGEQKAAKFGNSILKIVRDE